MTMRRLYGLGLLGTSLASTACAGDRESDGADATAGIATAGMLPGGDSDDADEGSTAGVTGAQSGGSEDDSSGGGPGLPKFDLGQGGPGSGGEDDCITGPNEDADGDGWSVAQGDCNDCDPNANPAAIEVVVTGPDELGNVPLPADEDCDGQVDNPPLPCDGGLALDDLDPTNGARAIGLCKTAVGANDWGVVSASYVRADGVPNAGGQQVGLQTQWGTNVTTQEGESMLVLSSGHSRSIGQAGACNALSCTGTGAGTPPAGFPQDVPGCAGLSTINDDIALEVTLRAPSNAIGYSYDFSFYSFEYPEWVCTAFNDQYIALVTPPPEGSINGNISFDSQSNPVSVNIAFFEVCSGCNLGTDELAGTGFDVWDDAGATSWLVTTAPVTGGEEFTIRFAIWDTGDSAWDSTVLIDNFQWIADGAEVDVGTEPEG